MEFIRTEIALLTQKREAIGRHYISNDIYEWWELIDDKDRDNYNKFYSKFCKVLDLIKNKKWREIVDKIDGLIEILKQDYEPNRHKRYFDPSLFPSGTMVNFDCQCDKNSSGIDYVVVKATKTYLYGYCVIGDYIGETKKFATKPRQILYICN